jgi:hypothetical protein
MNKDSKQVKTFKMFPNDYVDKEINDMRFVFSNMFLTIK